VLIKIIKLLIFRYVLSPENFVVNPVLYNPIQGFGNVSAFHNESIVFFSNPHFYLVENPVWINSVLGVIPNITIDKVFIDVEPKTGKVINAWKALQLNVYNNGTIAGLTFAFQNVINTMFPVCILAETATLSDKNANQIKDQLYLVLDARTIGFPVLLGVGGILFVLGCALAFYGFASTKSENYETIQ